MALTRSAPIRERDFLIWTPEFESSSTADLLLSELGLKKIITGYSSIWLDLRKDEDLIRFLYLLDFK